MTTPINQDSCKRRIGIGVARACTVFQFCRCITNASAFEMAGRRVSVGVTAAAFRFIPRKRPGYSFVVLFMAQDAGDRNVLLIINGLV